jgi:hypothetical protein
LLLKTFDFARRPRIVLSRRKIQFLICGERKQAKLNVFIIDIVQNNIVFVVEEHKLHHKTFPHGRLIASAIAAFQNNSSKQSRLGLKPIASQVGLIVHYKFSHLLIENG